MSYLIKVGHTYYVSIDGRKSEDGLSEKDPMNYGTLKKKKGFMTGEKILLKRDDVLYGNLFLKFDFIFFWR